MITNSEKVITIDKEKKPVGFMDKTDADELSVDDIGHYITSFLFQLESIEEPAKETDCYDMYVKFVLKKYHVVFKKDEEPIFQIVVNRLSNVKHLHDYVNVRDVYFTQLNDSVERLFPNVFLYAKAEEEQIFDSELEEEIQAEMHKDDDNEDETIYRIYRYKFYLDASHQVKIDGNIGEVHPHTWEFAVELKGMKHIIVPFNEIEATVNKVLDKYQEKCLNEMSPFDKLNPTSENIAGYFFSLIQYQMELNSWELLSLELSESPNRTIVITKD